MNDTPEWSELRDVLAETPGLTGFRVVCAIIDTWSGPDREAAIAFADRQLEAWPDELREAGWSWCVAAANGEPPPSWPLVRALMTAGTHMGCKNVGLTDVVRKLDPARIAHLRLGGIFGEDGSELDALLDRPWPSLRRLHVPSYFKNADHAGAVVGSPLVANLEWLHLTPRQRKPAAPLVFTRPMPNLRQLSLYAGLNDDLVAALESLDAPRMNELVLFSGFHDPFEVDAVKPLAHLPLLRQVRSLTIGTEWTDKALRTLARAGTLELETLAIVGNAIQDYMHTLNERRIGAAACRALAASGALKNLGTLSIQFQRIGDELVDLVRATGGSLRTLELIDVELTDEGAEALAALPQIAGLTTLNLTANALTPRGIRALAGSPHLANLRSLTLGGNLYDPYYGYCHPRPILDEGVHALLETRILDGLESLTLANAKIGAAGVRALISSPKLARLKRLDLTLNPFGMEPAHVLDAADLPALESLRLENCRLEDQSIAALVQGKIPRLRELDLSYNSVAADGARALAGWPGLVRLRVLNLHDNILDSAALIALSAAPRGQLVEFDIEQDCWNSRRTALDEAAGRAFGASPFFSRLEAVWAGLSDGYHGGRYDHLFDDDGMSAIERSALRPQARWGLAMSEVDASVRKKPRKKAATGDRWDAADHDFRSHPPKEFTGPPMETRQVGYEDIPSNEDEDSDDEM